MKPPNRAKKSSGRGRPPYQPSIEDRQTVEEMKYAGASDNVIARALGIDDDTLRKHLPNELENGHANRTREVITLLFKSARDGNISAQKRLEEMGRVAAAAESVNAGVEPAVKLGKKEQQQLAAGQVDGIYAPPGPPKLVVNNTRE